jgi:1,4-dihydroxy-2-naphthoate octaprenyltransferase
MPMPPSTKSIEQAIKAYSAELQMSETLDSLISKRKHSRVWGIISFLILIVSIIVGTNAYVDYEDLKAKGPIQVDCYDQNYHIINGLVCTNETPYEDAQVGFVLMLIIGIIATVISFWSLIEVFDLSDRIARKQYRS